MQYSPEVRQVDSGHRDTLKAGAAVGGEHDDRDTERVAGDAEKAGSLLVLDVLRRDLTGAI